MAASLRYRGCVTSRIRMPPVRHADIRVNGYPQVNTTEYLTYPPA